MANKPPYTITEKAADYLAKIVETATRLDLGTEFNRNIIDCITIKLLKMLVQQTTLVYL